MNMLYHFFFWLSILYRFWERRRFVKKERAAGKVFIKHFYSLMVILFFGLAFFNYFDFIFAQRMISVAAFCAGLILYVFAWKLRRTAMQILNKMFSPDIEIRKDHKLVQEGPYYYVRHPLLVALGVETLANALLASSELGVLLAIFLYWPLIWIRKTLEEKELIVQLGDSYRQYQKKTAAFFPVNKLWKK
jgi:protein-S-isoprenylcysteine O-methyltransferase Ste14